LKDLKVDGNKLVYFKALEHVFLFSPSVAGL